MSISKPVRFVAMAACTFVAVTNGYAEGDFAAQGTEYSLSGSLLGDQVHAAVAVGGNGGLLVWEDFFTDGDGSGISARLLDGTFSGALSSFRVNEEGAGNQGKPDAAVLDNGGAVLVWEGGAAGFEDVYARFLSPSNTWITGDVQVNSITGEAQEDPAVASLSDGEAVVVWSSYHQAQPGSMKDIYFQRFSASGQPLGGNTLVNQTTSLNQRSPSVVRLGDGRFLISWVGENRHLIEGQTEVYSVNVYGRLYSSSGQPQGGEFKLNTTTDVCANPSLAPSGDGGFLVAWSQKSTDLSNSWDVASRVFSSSGVGGAETILNSYRYGDQFHPKVAAIGSDYLVLWTSLRQDGSHEGVFARFVDGAGLPSGDEFQVNTTTFSSQFLPDVTSDGESHLLAIWSGFSGMNDGFNVYAQRYSRVLDPLIAPPAPYVWLLGPSELKLSWAGQDGLSIAHYEVFADGGSSATYTTTNNWIVADGLGPGSTHSYRLAYVLSDGRRSPLSAASSATTYIGYYYFGIPVEWMTENWGESWPPASLDSDGDGVTNLNEFLAGTDPNDAASVLRTVMVRSPQGYFLGWNTEPGGIYQVQQSTDFSTWVDYGSARFAPGDEDSVNVGGENSGLFRVVLLRN